LVFGSGSSSRGPEVSCSSEESKCLRGHPIFRGGCRGKPCRSVGTQRSQRAAIREMKAGFPRSVENHEFDIWFSRSTKMRRFACRWAAQSSHRITISFAIKMNAANSRAGRAVRKWSGVRNVGGRNVARFSNAMRWERSLSARRSERHSPASHSLIRRSVLDFR